MGSSRRAGEFTDVNEIDAKKARERDRDRNQMNMILIVRETTDRTSDDFCIEKRNKTFSREFFFYERERREDNGVPLIVLH